MLDTRFDGRRRHSSMPVNKRPPIILLCRTHPATDSVVVRMVCPGGCFDNRIMNRLADNHRSADSAVARVLAAEQEALQAIAACKKQAEATLDEARAAVRGLVRHTQDRISRLHADCAARTRALVAEIERDTETGGDVVLPGELDDDRLHVAVRAVARQLTERDASHAD